MKHELLSFLLCPICRCEVELKDSLREGEEILEGSLVCRGCTREFPIMEGVPRLVTGSEVKSTAERFGYEWANFPQLSPDYERQFLDWISPIDKDFFRGKVVLDAGCGKGRHLYFASRFGAKTVVGVDVSEAVWVAYANTKDLPNVHIIQANICRPPLKSVFDYIYSIGVLHHLAEPEEGFQALSGLLKPGGTISIWVYGREGNRWIIWFVNPVRKLLTSRMPLAALKKMSLPLAFFLYGICKFGYKPINNHLVRLARFLFYNDYLFYISKSNLKELHTIVFDHLVAPVALYLTKEEVEGWFQRRDLENIHISWFNKNSWRAKARSRLSDGLR